jgi:hypothetical protein
MSSCDVPARIVVDADNDQSLSYLKRSLSCFSDAEALANQTPDQLTRAVEPCRALLQQLTKFELRSTW